MASLDDLKDVLRTSLDTRGVLGPLKARIRSEVFKALNDTDDSTAELQNVNDAENLIINELIREYLEWNGLEHTLGVFVPEARMSSEALDRDFMCKEVNLEDSPSTKDIPLLYAIVKQSQMNRNKPSGSNS